MGSGAFASRAVVSATRATGASSTSGWTGSSGCLRGRSCRSMAELALRRADGEALALLDQAERALKAVATSSDAEDLFRKLAAIEHAAQLARVHADTQLRAGKLKLRAERRWGELLGPPVNPAGKSVTDGDRLNGRDKMARSRARQVAEVGEPVFRDYLERAQDPETLRRARLLRVWREAQPPPPISDAIFGDILLHRARRSPALRSPRYHAQGTGRDTWPSERSGGLLTTPKAQRVVSADTPSR